jgi:hypothetical protein
MHAGRREGLHVKFPLFLSDFNENWNMHKFLEQLPDFRGNPFSGSQIVTCGQTGEETDMVRVTNAFLFLLEGVEGKEKRTKKYFRQMSI